ncbi:short chain dehydrogenase [Reichenbachiella carrageenanivorans]|uniref:Short chain dehydrogenase n=1 Tax=Reichenbachiella carrageenanivorans TaxID=2979869 RepID=A0ABY6CY79_9BACT|nr:short chain dehydrogenase [Reichenbachiella carrageenanivorans]UXX77803.1 short chain dehydrogenase [Reichenbachiella carrageenanivorans]
MKIIIVGGHGSIGRRVVHVLAKKHDIVTASRSKGNVNVDLVDIESIRELYETVGEFDAVICIAGEAKWGAMTEMKEGDYYVGIRSKLMGQVNLVRIGMEYIKPNGSFTLTTGILGDHPVDQTTSAAMVNGGIHSFVKAAALEMTNGIRINAVSSGLVEDAVEKYQDNFPGHNAIPMRKVVNGYIKSLEGKGNGEIIKMYDNS